MGGTVVSVHLSPSHTMRKSAAGAIDLISGIGVAGDAHAGVTVKHRSRVAVDPTRPNLRQVHLIHQELIDELVSQGFQVKPGLMGENVTTAGIDLLGLGAGARLHLGSSAIVEVTGLRNPCTQLNGLQQGLMQAVLERDSEGRLIRKAGIMGIVLAGGPVKAGDAIEVTLPDGPHLPLRPV